MQLFISCFIVIFSSQFLVQEASIILIAFINQLLIVYESQFQLPKTLTTLRSWTAFDSTSSDIQKFVTCNVCHELYPWTSTSVIPNNCTGESFTGIVCNNPLFRVNPNTGVRGCPFKVFPYKSIISSLTEMFNRPDFQKEIRHWKNRTVPANTFSDIYDGAYWREVKDEDGVVFCDDDNSVQLTYNMDWFNPFSDNSSASYSCGAMYMTINDLPRDVRFKTLNLLVLGFMPGKKEASITQINNYSKLIVDELLKLYKGVYIRIGDKVVRIRATLLNITCDIPSGRKCAGFTSCTSTNACYKCKFQAIYDQNFKKMMFADFKRYDSRTPQSVHKYAKKWLDCKTESERKEVEKQGGVRFSQFQRLPYFDIRRCLVIDVFHNLFLGTASAMVALWFEKKFFNDRMMELMASRAKRVILPDSIQNPHSRIAAHFGQFTGSDWMTWTLIISGYVLKGILDDDCYKHWLLFVDACRLIIKPTVTLEEATAADALFLKFNKGIVTLYGKQYVKPNHHYHLHILSGIKDFSTVYSTWLYIFERYNKTIKNIVINYKDGFEVTYMRSFLEAKNTNGFINRLSDPNQKDLCMTKEHSDFLRSISRFSKTNSASVDDGDIAREFYHNNMEAFYKLSSMEFRTLVKGCEPAPIAKVDKGKLVKMSPEHYKQLQRFYQTQAYPEHFSSSDSFSSPTFTCTDTILIRDKLTIAGQTYRSSRSLTTKGSFISAFFTQSSKNEAASYPGQVSYYFEHTPRINNKRVTHTFAFTRWFGNLGQSYQTYSKAGLEYWSSCWEPLDALAVLPIARIYGHVSVVFYDSKSDDKSTSKVLVFPMPKKVYA